MKRRVKNPGITKVRAFKKAGGSKAHYLEIVTAGLRVTAKKEGWRPSETAMAIVEKQRLADIVWPD